MQTIRLKSTALCTGTALIVTGGRNTIRAQTVEVLNTVTLQWSTAADLRYPLSHAPVAVCGDQVYILGDSNMYTCSLPTLTQPLKSFLASLKNRLTRVWKQAAAPPVTETAFMSIHGQLLAVGGADSEKETHLCHSHVQPNH